VPYNITMPRPSKFGKPRAVRKPTLAKAKSMVTKSHKKAAKKNMDTFFLKTKSLFNVTPSQGLTTSNYIYSVVGMDPSGINAAYIGNAEFELYRLQYDKFRVNSVTYRCTPKANVLDATNAQKDSDFTLTGDGLCHTCIDRDGPAPSSMAAISRYPSYKSFSLQKKWSRTYSIKYPTGIWIDCQTPSSFSMIRELGLSGGITIYAENLPEDVSEITNEPWAEVTVEFNIVFQGKQSNKLSGVYDSLGNLTGVTISQIAASEIKAITPLQNVRGRLDGDTRTDSDTLETVITSVD